MTRSYSLSAGVRSFIRRSIVAGAACTPALSASHAQGAVVFLVGETEPIYGYLVRQTEASVELEVVDPTGSRRRLPPIPREKIEDLIVTVSPERLAALSPDVPLEYLQYAEELSVKKQDPEARDAARRLYLLAGSLNPEKLGRQALLGLASVTHDPAEAKRARTFAALLDPNTPLPDAGDAAAGPSAIDPTRAGIVVNAIQAYRRGKVSTARRALGDEENRKAIKSLTPDFPEDRLAESLSERDFRPDAAVLAALVAVELRLRFPNAETTPGQAADPFADEARLPVAWPTWATIAKEFDLAQTVFVDGQWRKS